MELTDATLQQQSLHGQLQLRVARDELEILGFTLRGDGFSLQAQGALADRIQLSWQVEKLQQLFSGVQGQLSGSAFMNLASEGISAEFSSQGRGLRYDQLSLASWQLQGEIASSQQLQLTLTAQDFQSSPGVFLQEVQLGINGSFAEHLFDIRFTQGSSSLHGKFYGGWEDGQWQGDISQLRLEDSRVGLWETPDPAPLQLNPEQLQLGRLVLLGPSESSILLQGSYSFAEQRGEGELDWQALDLSLFNQWLRDRSLTAVSSGQLTLIQHPAARFQGRVSIQGELKDRRQTITLTEGFWQVVWGERDYRASLACSWLMAAGSTQSWTMKKNSPCTGRSA